LQFRKTLKTKVALTEYSPIVSHLRQSYANFCLINLLCQSPLQNSEIELKTGGYTYLTPNKALFPLVPERTAPLQTYIFIDLLM